MHSVERFFLSTAPGLLADFAWPMFWQSTLLIGFLFLMELALRGRLRPAVRYSLWLLVLLKLTLPPSFALRTGVGWWIRPTASRPSPARATAIVVHFHDSKSSPGPAEADSVETPPARAFISPQASLLLFWAFGSLGLFIWMMRRWREVALAARRAEAASPHLEGLLQLAHRSARFIGSVRLGISEETSSPVVFGFFRPIILLPASLSSTLSETQMGGVLLHELIHLRRRDVWFNCAQTLLQIVYWWHPFLWVANARIRRLREEAVDDAVMCALREKANEYPQTLIEVAKLALGRPLSGLALVGILESRVALRRRIERLVEFRFPKRAGLTLGSVLSLVVFGALALPMGPAPVRMAEAPSHPNSALDNWPDPRFQGYTEISLNARFLIVDASLLELFLPAIAGAQSPLVLNSNEIADVERKLVQAGAELYPKAGGLTHTWFSGGRFHYRVGGVNENGVDYQAQTNANGAAVVLGAECSTYVGPRPDWVPLDFSIVPWLYRGATLCQVRLGTANDPGSALESEATIPTGGAMFWMAPGLPSGKAELVFIKEAKPDREEAPNKMSEASDTGAEAQNKEVIQLVGDARRFFESGKLDEAEALLHKALALDRQSPSAHYYLGLIVKARAEQRPPVRLIHPGGTNLVFASNAPQTIYSELERIRLKEISFDHLPLAEVLRRLNDEVSPDFTFRLKPLPTVASPESKPLSAPGATADISQATITILPSLVDVRLLDVLEVIVRVSNQRIQYSIQKDTVEFSAAASNPKPMYTRIIKVELTTMLKRLAEALGESDLTDPKTTISALRRLLLSKGVSLQPPETLFLNDREETLMVHATLEHLDILELTIQDLNGPQLQLNIKNRFLHVPDSDLREFWNAIGVVRVDPTNYSKILTPAQTAVLLKAISAKHGDYLMNEASVTTLSRRQCEVQCVNLRTIFSNNVPSQIPFGPSIDITPVLMPDSWKVNLRTVATVKEFLGYDEPSRFLPQFEDPRGHPEPQAPVPHIRVRQLSSNSTVPDGCTLVLGNLVSTKGELHVSKPSPAEELFGPIEKPSSSEGHYIVLLTPTVLLPTGARLHTDAEIEAFTK